ncbi:MAG: GH3 auxin-responsive promoter family protein, partial [Bacteroidota bacterium]
TNSTVSPMLYPHRPALEFVSLNPYRIKVTGRTKHFISAFGEHVIGKEVETAMNEVAPAFGAEVVEFTVAPQVAPPEGGLPYHQWLVEFSQLPQDMAGFSAALDQAVIQQNVYYRDLIDGKILRPLVVTPLPPDSFRNYMRSLGKLGGQNKVPRLSDNRKIADALLS